MPACCTPHFPAEVTWEVIQWTTEVKKLELHCVLYLSKITDIKTGGVFHPVSGLDRPAVTRDKPLTQLGGGKNSVYGMLTS